MTYARSLMRTKPVEQITQDGSNAALRRALGLWPLVALSIGATLGTGIFVVLADAAPVAGPAVVISFVIAGVAALCSALSYAELAGSVPVSGSAYSYTYATLGELIAWVCGWCLLLEYGVSVAAVAVGWGAYLNEFFRGTIGVTIPDALAAPPGEAEAAAVGSYTRAPRGRVRGTGGLESELEIGVAPRLSLRLGQIGAERHVALR